ncbi:aldo/keto reductase [Actinopolymorpha pittospori]|uniref:Dehydrogenase/aryl-alcohol dehydrogenase-like putative oxidoreductase n=1 Tax=Actinopolymorpha pittospori TaxID=648752 RepID=A0A927RDF6_9ACTN|nr:aldo/keto reductase [Actinopolymorpha pittospori]MBE1612347.1 putative dehydrogenase/aryl-alcohol dehydrogenase-like putative oxidoreductase [Actinopolymorpha pittospori]
MGRDITRADGKLGWGILGPGNIARRFAADLPASRTGVLVAVGSRDIDKANKFAAEFGGARGYGSYEELLNDDEVDAVYISTPHPQHAQWAIRAAEAGKHILCEKPLTVNHAEAMAVIEAAREHDVFLMEAFMYRCVPQTEKLLELLREGAIGTIHQIEASFAFGSRPNPGSRLWDAELAGGGILDVGGYPVTMARLIAGAAVGKPFADPESLTAVGRVGETGVDEWAAANLTFAGGVSAHVVTGIRHSAENVVRVVGSEGYLVVANSWLPGRDGGSSGIDVYRIGEEDRHVEVEQTPLYAAEADSVADHLAERQSPAMSWADSLGTAATLDSWRQAIGLTYPSERIDADRPTVHGRPLARRSEHTMRYSEIPGVGKPVSRLVMGVDNQTALPHATAMFDDFFERGGTTFDTAYIYGRGMCERVLGQWIKNRGIREEVVVIGKGAHTPHCDPESITRQLHESLERLQTDYVDVYFMHRDNTDYPVSEFVDVLDEHFRAGRIKAFGGSNWTLERIAEANAYAQANGRQPFVAVSNNFSLARAMDVPWAGCLAVSDDESRTWLETNQLALMPWSSQARGFFTGRAKPEDRSDAELVRCWYSDENFERLARAQDLAQRRGVDPTAIALAYVLHQDFPTFPLIGPRAMAETHSSLAALQVELSPEEVRWLDLRD